MIKNVGEETAGTSEWVEDKKKSLDFKNSHILMKIQQSEAGTNTNPNFQTLINSKTVIKFRKLYW